MGRISDFLIGCCEFFDAGDLLGGDDLDSPERLAQLIWDLNDAANDFGRRVSIDTATHTLRLVPVGDAGEGVTFAAMDQAPAARSQTFQPLVPHP